MAVDQSRGSSAGWYIGGAATGLVGGGLYLGSNAVRNNIPKLEQRVVASKETLARSIPTYPPNMTSEQAVEALTKRFGDGAVLTAYTQDGDAKLVSADSIYTTAVTSESEALNYARAKSGGRSTATLRAGDWFVPATLSDSLNPIQRWRTETYTEYEYGYNPSTGNYENHPVTRTREVPYLATYYEFEPSRHGVSSAANGAQEVMDNIGTVEQQAVREAEGKLHAAKTGAPVMKYVGIGCAVLAVGLLGLGLYKTAQGR